VIPIIVNQKNQRTLQKLFVRQSFIDHILRRIPKKAQSQQFENG
jgi:hypothetical protein